MPEISVMIESQTFGKSLIKKGSAENA